MNLNLSVTLFLALVAGATAIKHETSTEAKVQPVQLINYRTVLKGGLPLQDKLVFMDMDNDDKKNDNNDDKKNNNNDDKNDKDDDDDKKNKDDDDDDDKKSRSGSVPECKTNGVNYHKCYPATMKPSDKDTCDSIENDVCGKDMSNSDKDYCKCMGFNGKTVVTTAGFSPVRKGSGSSNHKQIFVDLDSDDGGKTNNENKKTTDNGTDGNKNNVDNDDKKSQNNDYDDKKNKDDDDDKKNKDDDDDKKNKDDDDDDDKKSRNMSVPECITGGKNYLRCDPATMKTSDKDTCNAIKNEVCGKNMSSSDHKYCECIGLDGRATAQLRGAMTALF